MLDQQKLAALAGYDIMLAVDVSGSMGTPSKRYPGKTRLQEVEEAAFQIALEAEKHDDNGIDIITFGAQVDLIEGVPSAKIPNVFASHPARGSTPLHKALQLAFAKQARTGRNTILVVFTDGAPDDQVAARDVIVAKANAITSDENMTVGFVQIGDDVAAARYLSHLDEGLSGARHDIVDVVTAEQAEQMDPLELLQKFIAD